MQITDIRPQKSSKGRLASGQKPRVNLYLDGKFALGLDLETLVSRGLKIGDELSKVEFNELKEISGRKKIFDKVLNFLSFRPRSEKEVKDYLFKKKVDEEEAGAVIKELKEKGYLNDEEFARWWIEQRQTFRPKARRVLVIELRQKGIAQDLIVKSLNDYINKDTEFEMALKLAKKKAGTLEKLPPDEFRQKLGNYLVRRGFEWEIVKHAIDLVIKKEYYLK